MSTEVPINDDDILWNIHAYSEPGNIIRLEWGWTAGMSDDEIADIADDAPNWKDTVKITMENARALRDKLNKLLGEN